MKPQQYRRTFLREDQQDSLGGQRGRAGSTVGAGSDGLATVMAAPDRATEDGGLTTTTLFDEVGEQPLPMSIPGLGGQNGRASSIGHFPLLTGARGVWVYALVVASVPLDLGSLEVGENDSKAPD